MAKTFAWSYSKAKNYLTCAKRYYEVDIAKNFADSTEQLLWGNEVHKALADACTGKTPLPASMKDYQIWVDRYAGTDLPGQLLVEQQYAITRDFRPTQWFAGNVWFRSVCDLLRIDGPVARSVDWKTGKPIHDSRQLMLSAQCVFAHHPQVKRIYTEFVWLKENDLAAVTPEVFNRDTIVREWPPVLEIAKEMEHAAATMNYPPKPGKLCARYCPVLSCTFHGKRHS